MIFGSGEQSSAHEHQHQLSYKIRMEEPKPLHPHAIVHHEEIDIERDRVPILYPVGQMHGTYIVAQNEQGMYLIDQHAAQERIKYEYFREKVKEEEPNVQDLLVPLLPC